MNNITIKKIDNFFKLSLNDFELEKVIACRINYIGNKTVLTVDIEVDSINMNERNSEEEALLTVARGVPEKEMALYDKIKELCKKKNIPVSKAEEDLGFSRGSLCKWDNSVPSFSRVSMLAKYFEVPIDFFLK